VRTRLIGFTGALVGSVGTAGLVAGCSASPAGEARDYPASVSQARVLDVQVSRRGTTLFMTNTTARSFDAGTLWVNQRFGAPVPPFDIGQTLELDLRSFVDETGDRFRAGGFFATREPDRVVLAQLEVGGRLLGLVVVENRY